MNIAPRLTPAYRDCKIPLLIMAVLGEFSQGQPTGAAPLHHFTHLWQLTPSNDAVGGLMFGWNALALILKGQNIYSTGCAAERAGVAILQ